jgi:hypothetical protein
MLRMPIMFRLLILVSAGFLTLPLLAAGSRPVEITINMKIDVDGAPNAYGPKSKKTLDYELNAHEGAQASGRIVGYLTKKDGYTPELQGRRDPFPGYYISTTGFCDKRNPNLRDPRRYVNASRVNYVVLADVAKDGGVALGDFVAVYSKKTRRAVFGIVGDSGNPAGAEGSLALLRALGYPFKNGKSGEAEKEIVIRYFPGSNPERRFFRTQAQLDRQARALRLSKKFSSLQR